MEPGGYDSKSSQLDAVSSAAKPERGAGKANGYNTSYDILNGGPMLNATVCAIPSLSPPHAVQGEPVAVHPSTAQTGPFSVHSSTVQTARRAMRMDSPLI
jgi:hypothetical protein